MHLRDRSRAELGPTDLCGSATNLKQTFAKPLVRSKGFENGLKYPHVLLTRAGQKQQGGFAYAGNRG